MNNKTAILSVLVVLCLGLLGLYYGMTVSHEQLPITVDYAENGDLRFTVEEPYVLQQIQSKRHHLNTSGIGAGTRSFLYPVEDLGPDHSEILTLRCADSPKDRNPDVLRFHISGQTDGKLLIDVYRHDFLMETFCFP